MFLRTTHLFNARISWAKPDPELGWRNVSGSRYWHNAENDHPITGKFNSFGWRDREWSLEKPINIYRIAVLGDSYVEAFQVESDRTFLSLAQKALNENHHRGVELMNFGRSGFTQTEEYIILQNEVIHFSPDMVILFFLPGNDIEDITAKNNTGTMRPVYKIDENEKLFLDTSFNQTQSYKIKVLISPIKNHSAIISLMTERYNFYLMRKKADKIISTHTIDPVTSLATNNPDPVFLKNYKLNKILIKKIADYCKKKGIRFMLVTTDTDAYKPEIEREYKSVDPTFNPFFFEDDLMEYSKSLNVDYIGLQRIFRKHYETTKLPLHWGHWNYEGHKVVASAITEKLKNIFHSDTQQ